MTQHPLSRDNCGARTGQKFVAGGREYVLRGKIGDGAAGVVRKATDLKTNRLVAVKLLAPDPKYIDPNAFNDVAQRFGREGKRGAKLEHENLVKIIAYEDNEDGVAFSNGSVVNPLIVMEFVSGRTLESLIRNLERDTAEHAIVNRTTLSIASRILNALRYLHERKIVHRDVKPANVFLSSTSPTAIPSEVKLADFGVTKWGDFLAAAASGTLTVTHQQGLGTLKYMSPEQSLRPRDVTVRSDMFSVGITLFELFSGRILPSPHHVFEIMSARLARSPTVSKLNELGVRCPQESIEVFDVIFDCFLMGAKGRPTSAKLAGNLEYLLELYD